MPDTLDQWHTEHVNFAKLLNLLEAELDLFHEGDSPNYELMLDIMFYMTHYPDVLHHPREDLAFAKIKEAREERRADGRRACGTACAVAEARRGTGRRPQRHRKRIHCVARKCRDARTRLRRELPQPYADRGEGNPAHGGQRSSATVIGPRSKRRFNISTTRSSGKPRKSDTPRSISRSQGKRRPQRRRRASHSRANVGRACGCEWATATIVNDRMPWAPWINTPSMSAVADGPVMNTPYPTSNCARSR